MMLEHFKVSLFLSFNINRERKRSDVTMDNINLREIIYDVSD